jgi:hypothetical protein
MPLATGATAFKTAAISTICLIGVFGIVLAVVFFDEAPLFSIVMGLGCAVWPLIILLMAGDARKRRASDVLFDDDGFRVSGGPNDRFHGEWQTLKASNFVVAETTELFEKDGDKPAQNIFQFSVAGVVLAESGDPTEIASLQSVKHAMQHAVASKAEKSADTKPPTPTVATESCSQCGAPLVPSDVDEVVCVYCGKTNVVPASLRESIRSAAQADRARQDIGRAVSRALTQGNATATNYALSAFWVAAHFGLALAAICVWKRVPWLVLPTLAAPFALAAVAQILVARRFALRALTSGCAALTPRDPARAPMCRRCRAPLPTSDDPTRVIATCAYCQTANIVGLPFGMAEETVDTDIEIEAVIRKQRRGVATWSGVLIVAAIVMTSGIVLAAKQPSQISSSKSLVGPRIGPSRKV